MIKIRTLAAGLFLAASAFMLTSAQSHATVIISSNNVQNDASPFPRFGDTDAYNSTAIPLSHLVDATKTTAWSRTQIEHSVAGGWTTLSYTLNQQRPGTQYASAQSRSYGMEFTVDVDSTYDISGFYAAIDGDSDSSGTLNFFSHLEDRTIGSDLHLQNSVSKATVNESFALGVADGDFSDTLAGALTGELLAGRNYRWTWYLFSIADPGIDGGASAAGNLTLRVHDGTSNTELTSDSELTSVSEPATLAIFGVGLAGLGLMRRRRRSAE